MSRLYNILAQLVKADRRELLWTNPHPTQNFAAGKVLLTLTGYDAVEIESIGNVAAGTIIGQIRVKKGDSVTLTVSSGADSSSQSSQLSTG